MTGLHTVLQIQLDGDAQMPYRAYPGDAGLDLHVLEDTFIFENTYADVRSGVRIALPEGWFCRIVGRSSAFRKKGVMVLEGTIDAGFRGELFTTAFCPPTNKSAPDGGVWLRQGESICQLIVQPVPHVLVSQVAALPDSERGEAGFGSSGR